MGDELPRSLCAQVEVSSVPDILPVLLLVLYSCRADLEIVLEQAKFCGPAVVSFQKWTEISAKCRIGAGVNPW
eukprot:365121-Rhodomonas_salina.4